jgi:sugar (pentulose or hexulose) kinase
MAKALTHVLSIDLGTTGVRVALVDRSSRISWMHYASVHIDSPGCTTTIILLVFDHDDDDSAHDRT